MTLSSQYQLFVVQNIDPQGIRDGEILNASNASLTETLNQMESFTFELAAKDAWNAKIVMSQTQVQVVRNNVILWWGIVTNMVGNGGVFTYVVQDFSWLFTKRWVGPAVKVPFYTTRFQLSGAAGSGVVMAENPGPGTITSLSQSVLFAFGSRRWLASKQGAAPASDNWYRSYQVGGDIAPNGTRWNGFSSEGRYVGTVPQIISLSGTNYPTAAALQGIGVLDTTTDTVDPSTDIDGSPVVPFSGTQIVFIDPTAGIDTVGTYNPSANASGIASRLYHYFIMSNPTNFSKTVYAVAYLRLNSSRTKMDPFSSPIKTTNSGTTSLGNAAYEPLPAIAKFGIVNSTHTTDTPGPMGSQYTDWVDVARLTVDDLPSGQWIRAVLSVQLPPQTVNANLAFEWCDTVNFATSTPTYSKGYCIGGLDVTIDDGLFYKNANQFAILNAILSYIQNSANGWESLGIVTSIQTSTFKRTKQYLFSDYQTAYDAIYEFTTLLNGYDFYWTYDNNYKSFRGVFSPPAPGTTIGTSVGRGTIKDITFSSGIEITDYTVTADGTQLADVVSVFEPSTDTVDGSARDVASITNVPAGRWQLAEVYEGTPGGDTLTLQSQAQRGYNRYSKPAYSIDITIRPQDSDTVLVSTTVGDVIHISIPELGLNKTQFRITGRTTILDTDLVTVNLQQFYGL